MKPFIEQHNRQQREYFEASVKKTMLPTSTPYVQRQVHELLQAGSLRTDQRLLEVGCGMGRYTLPLAALGYQVEGLDLSPVLLERLSQSNAGRFSIPLYSADIINHPPELDGQYDAVIGFFTLHHLHDLPGCFAAMTRLLRPGGQILFLEPNAYNPLYYLQITFSPGMTWQGDGGIVQMRSNVIYPAMRAAGLSKLRLLRFGFFPPFLANRPGGQKVESWLERFPLWKGLLPFQIFAGERPAA